MDEKNSKEELLSELYAIRATMSIVSEKDDSAEPTRERLNRSRFVIKNYSSDCAINEENFSKAQKRVADLKMEKEFYTNEVKKYTDELNQPIPFFKQFAAGDHLGTAIGAPIFIGLIVGVFFGLWLTAYLSHPYYNWSIFCITFFVFLFGPPMIVIPTYCRCQGRGKEFRRRDRIKVDYLVPARENLKKTESELQKAEQEFQQTSLSYQGRTSSLQTEYEQANADQDACQKHLIELGLESQAIIDCARETYRSIDYRDWENVDLLIFYFETGRADSLKEALQLVDRQKQTNEIVSAIRYASKAISMTIESSVKKLGQALALSFDRLSAQIGIQHRELIDSFEKQRLEISENMEKSAELQMISQQMQTSLLQKIDRSSADLKEDMEKQLRYVHGIYY